MAFTDYGLDLDALQAAIRADYDDEVASQIARPIVLAKFIPAKPCTNVIQWDVRTGTARPTTAVLADGESVTTWNKDTYRKAVLYPGTYHDAFKVSRKAVIGAQLSGNPAELRDLVGERLKESAEKLAYAIAYDMYYGTGEDSDHMLGLLTDTESTHDPAGGLEDHGTYAGIDRASVTQFAATVLDNGGTYREFEVKLMDDLEESVYRACQRSPDLYVAGTKQFKKYKQAFGDDRRYVQEVTLRGQKIVLDAGVQALEYGGAYIVRDALLDDNRILAINTGTVQLRYMPDPDATIPLAGSYDQQNPSGSTGLKARITVLPADGDFINIGIWAYPQIQVRHPFWCGQLTYLNA